MDILSGGQSDFFGLDIGTTGIRVVQLKGGGATKTLDRYGYQVIPGTVAMSDSKADLGRISQAVHELVTKTGIESKQVAVNVPSSKVFTTVVDMAKMPPEELTSTLRYQAESFIPTPLTKSKIDWAIIGNSPKEAGKVEVLLSSVANEFVEARLSMLESIGLNVIAFEPDSMALTRALVPVDNLNPQLILDVGSNATDLVITMGGAPHLTRAIPTGTQALVRAAVQNLNIDAAQAEQFVFKFGIGKDKLEGQIYNAILSTVEVLMTEIDKSIKFFQGRYPNNKLEKIIVTGGAAALPEFPLYIANKFGLNVEIGNSWRNVNFSSSRQNELLAISNHFAVAVGLAERDE